MGNKKSFGKYTGSKRKTKERVCPLLKGKENHWQMTLERHKFRWLLSSVLTTQITAVRGQHNQHWTRPPPRVRNEVVREYLLEFSNCWA